MKSSCKSHLHVTVIATCPRQLNLPAITCGNYNLKLIIDLQIPYSDTKIHHDITNRLETQTYCDY